MNRCRTISRLPQSRLAAGRRGFTLIELLIVITIIIILAGITVAVGLSAKTNAGIRSTKNTLKSLDGLMKEFIAAGNPEPTDIADPADQVNWVKVLQTSPDIVRKMSSYTTKDYNGSRTIVDSFGNAIRYVPASLDPTTKNVLKLGYFQSFGPDGKPDTSDDIFSTDPQ